MTTPQDAQRQLHERLLLGDFDALFTDDREADHATLAEELAGLTADAITAQPGDKGAVMNTVRRALGA